MRFTTEQVRRPHSKACVLDNGRQLLRRMRAVLKTRWSGSSSSTSYDTMKLTFCCVLLLRPTACSDQPTRPESEPPTADPQAQKLLEVRREHLRRLHRIYEDRRQVNLEAISVLVGGPPCAATASCHCTISLPQTFLCHVCVSWTASAATFWALDGAPAASHM